MQAEQLFTDYTAKQVDTTASARLLSSEAYATYCAEVQDLTANARNRAQQLWQTYTQELKAASSGDDMQQRSGAAYQSFQRDYAKLDSEFQTACRASYTKLTEAMGSLAADVQTKTLNHLLEYLHALKDASSQVQSKPHK